MNCECMYSSMCLCMHIFMDTYIHGTPESCLGLTLSCMSTCMRTRVSLCLGLTLWSDALRLRRAMYVCILEYMHA